MSETVHSAERDAGASPDYIAGMRWAANVAHAEARYQTELAARAMDLRERAKHRYVAERASSVEASILNVIACILAPGVSDV